MPINNLWIIMPVYNEEEAIEHVVHEWMETLAKVTFPYTFCILNDGSKDNTLEKLQQLAKQYQAIYLVNKSNTGHGQTCILGYQMAIERGADWIFQIDSDGQCDPQYFRDMIPQSEKHHFVYGIRRTRDDGFQRMMVSFFVTIFTFAATGQWIRDANVPYRLMNAEQLKSFVYHVPTDFHLANIYVSVCCQRLQRIKWIPIHFRDRMGGRASVKTFSFVKHGFKLFKQLRAAK
jgi:Glycosyltransferases involved in cell wall biogenesis